MIELLLIAVALLLVAACGAFVAAEFAFVTVDRGTVDREAEAGDRRAQGVRTALRSLSTQLSGAQVGITLTNLLIGFLAEPSVASLLRGPLEDLGAGESLAEGIALAVALLLATTVTMVFGELVPKNLAIAQPLRTAKAVQGFQRGFSAVMGVVIRSFNGVANRLLLRVGIEPQEELASARSAEELSSLVRRSAQEGTLEEGTADLLERSLLFGERHAEDVMTPRERITVARPDETVDELLRLARRSGRSRFPVLEHDSDRVGGVVHIKDAMSVPYEQRDVVHVSAIVQEPVLVPTTLDLDELLLRLRRGGLQLAIVINEFGGVDGLVTLEDLVEEVVGEVRDEHDPQDDAVRRLPDGRWDVSGLLRPDEVDQRTGIAVPEHEDYETIAGLVAKELEHVPRVGERVVLALPIVPEDPDAEPQERRVVLEVLAMDDLRVDRLAISEDLTA